MCQTSILLREDCRKILKKLHNDEDFILDHYEFSSFEEPLRGLVGEHSKLKISYEHKGEEKQQEFFVKSVSSNPFMYEFSLSIQVYEKEEFYYNFLDELARYDIDTSFAPKGYFFKPYVVVLEDLAQKGFKPTRKRIQLDADYCKICLKTIASFHASSIAYEVKKSKELGREFCLLEEHPDILVDKLGLEDTIAARWKQNSIQGILELVELITPDLKEKLLDILSSEVNVSGQKSAITHGDLWSTNFLYKYENSRAPHCKLLDFQLIKYGPIESDIVEFLMTNTSREFRKENFVKLIEFYYENLRQSLIKAGVDCDEISIGSCAEFVSSCNNFKLAGKLHAIVDHSYTFAPDEYYAEAMESGETFKRFIFEERGKYIIRAYNQHDEFRNVLGEDLLDLRDLLLEEE